MTCFERQPFDEALTVELAVSRHAPVAGFAASALTELGDDRARPGPVMLNGRCFVTETREELADARNYLVWEHRRRRGRPPRDADLDLDAIERAIAAIATAWQHLDELDLLDAGAGCAAGTVEQRPQRGSLPAAAGADHPRAVLPASHGARVDREPRC